MRGGDGHQDERTAGGTNDSNGEGGGPASLTKQTQTTSIVIWDPGKFFTCSFLTFFF
jgi:hypothetical protein